MSTSRGCASSEQLRLLALGKLNGPQLMEIEGHLLECDRCAGKMAIVELSDPLVDIIRELGGCMTPSPQSSDPRVVRLMESLATIRTRDNPDTDLTHLTETQPNSALCSADIIDEYRASFRPPESADELGRISGYRILRVLGMGGMGTVFLAEDLLLRRPVALKMMRPKAATLSNASERFLSEARSAAILRHDNILTIYQVGEENGVPYLAMEHLEGETLENRLQTTSSPTISTMLRIGREIALGLSAAHTKGLIHRDIKPANIWLESFSDRVKLLDFGLAKMHEVESHMTSTGVIVGTPAYMAPEQASGERVTPRTDLFSLGVVLYRMATGNMPFPGKNAIEILKSLATVTPQSVRDSNPQIPAEYSDLIDQLLRKNSEDRPLSAARVADRLEEIEQRLDRWQNTGRSDDRSRTSQDKVAVYRTRFTALVAFSAIMIMLAVIVLKVNTKDGKETEVMINVPGELASVHTSIDHGSRGRSADSVMLKTVPMRADADLLPGIEFDGINGTVSVPELPVLSTSDWTFEAWVTPFSAKKSSIIWIGSPYWAALEINENHFGIGVVRDGEGGEVWAKDVVVPKKRVHIAAVSLNKKQRLFVDGRENNFPQTKYPATWNVSGPLTISGVNVTNDNNDEAEFPFHGVIHQVRVSEGARYSEEFEPPLSFDAGSGLVNFQFDAGSGSSIRDISGNNRNGILTGGKWVICKSDGNVITNPTPSAIRNIAKSGLAPDTDSFPKILAKNEPIELPATFTNSIGMDFVKVPKGMGWLGGGGGMMGNKAVEFKEDFYLGKYEVTQEDWAKVTGLAPSHWSRTGGGREAVSEVSIDDLKRFPVEMVSWEDCQAFVERLSKSLNETGWTYRLPSEEEWEYACRGGPVDRIDSSFDFYFDRPLLNVSQADGRFCPDDAIGLQRPPRRVGSYEPNRLGLFDMHGNIREWTSDALISKEGAPHRVMRGGSWSHPVFQCTASLRGSRPQTYRDSDLGLRVIRVRTQKSVHFPIE